MGNTRKKEINSGDCLAKGLQTKPCSGGRLRRGYCDRHYRKLIKWGDPLHLNTGEQADEWVNELVVKMSWPEDECIEWPYSKDPKGYPRRQNKFVSHEILSRIGRPRPSPKALACHEPLICHNTSCVNPNHLRWDTAWGNNSDRAIDNTKVRGEELKGSKLTEEQVLEIYNYDGPLLQRELAKNYGVNQSQISAIKCGYTWSWLTGHACKLSLIHI